MKIKTHGPPEIYKFAKLLQQSVVKDKSGSKERNYNNSSGD